MSAPDLSTNPGALYLAQPAFPAAGPRSTGFKAVVGVTGGRDITVRADSESECNALAAATISASARCEAAEKQRDRLAAALRGLCDKAGAVLFTGDHVDDWLQLHDDLKAALAAARDALPELDKETA